MSVARLVLAASVLSVAACAAAPTAAPPAAATDKGYSGHGLESVSPELLAKFAAPPLPPALSARIQAMLDVRAPGSGRISEDGKHLYFGWGVTGVGQVWRIDGPQTFPIQMTGGEDPTSIASIAPDGTFVVIQRDHAGEEYPGLYLQDPTGGPLKPIQHVKKVQTFFEFVSDDSKWVYFRANDVKPDSFALYRWNVAAGKREMVFDQDGLWSIADHREDGTLLLQKSLGSAQSEFWQLDPRTKELKPVIGQGELEDYEAAFGAKPGEYLVLTPKIGDFKRIYHFAGGQLEPLSPEIAHDVESLAIDRQRRRLYYEVNDDGYTRLHVIDAGSGKELKLPKLPRADHVYLSGLSRNGRYAVLSLDTGRAPFASYVLDWRNGKLTQWHTPSAPEIDTSRFAIAALEHYPARDGTRIPMFVRRPEQCTKADLAQPCPVIVVFHGGPEGQAQPGFALTWQLLVDAGFIVAEPNVRGSTGYGKKWFHADDGPRRLDIITDIEDAAKYVKTAWAVKGKAPKVGIYGGSYGGYSTLMGMTMFAGAYDAGVEVVGISNLVTFLENTAPYRRKLRVNEYGDPEKDREALVKLSPLTYVDRISGPLLMIQGANDPRVPVGEAVQVQQALEAKRIPNQLIVFADEGHGAQKRSNRALQIGHMLKFFQEHL
jgi:dipeptidyl aminopeptidase/acylaminoacyl peptidase